MFWYILSKQYMSQYINIIYNSNLYIIIADVIKYNYKLSKYHDIIICTCIL